MYQRCVFWNFTSIGSGSILRKGTLATYLARIMRNLSVSRYRKNVLWDEQLDTPLEDPASIPESAEARVDLERAMAALKPEDAEIIRMKYYGGMTAREIAASLGLSYDTVKSAISEACLR